MKTRLLLRLSFLGLPFLILLSLHIASAASLTMTSSALNLTLDDTSFTAEAVKPSACSSITLDDNIVTGSTTLTDTTGKSSLLITTGGDDAIYGLDGDDCLVANSGADSLDGGSGADVCLGQGGNDTFNNCEACYGGSGSDTDMTGSCIISDSIESP
jgi:hypothetical protein